MKRWAGLGANGGGGRRGYHQRMRKELRKKLRGYDFTYFITLASNHQEI